MEYKYLHFANDAWASLTTVKTEPTAISTLYATYPSLLWWISLAKLELLSHLAFSNPVSSKFYPVSVRTRLTTQAELKRTTNTSSHLQDVILVWFWPWEHKGMVIIHEVSTLEAEAGGYRVQDQFSFTSALNKQNAKRKNEHALYPDKLIK